MENQRDDLGKILTNMSSIIQRLITSSAHTTTSGCAICFIDIGATGHMIILVLFLELLLLNRLFSDFLMVKLPVSHKGDIHLFDFINLKDTLRVPISLLIYQSTSS